MMEYLDGNQPTVAQLKACIRKGTLALDFVPVTTGTAFKNKGVQVCLTRVRPGSHAASPTPLPTPRTPPLRPTHPPPVPRARAHTHTLHPAPNGLAHPYHTCSRCSMR